MTEQELQIIRDGFEVRVRQMFEAERGKPLVRAKKQPPLGPNRGNYVRAYSFSMMEFATRCFVLNEQIDEANAAVIENAQHYLDNPKDVNDRDSFHWHSEMVSRHIEMYGAKGSSAPGRLTHEAEEKMMEQLWRYASRCIPLAAAEVKVSRTWHIHESDNHHVQGFTTAWHFAKLAKDSPDYRDRKYEDGSTAAEQYAAWSEYVKVYCLERARRGLFVEVASGGYNAIAMKGIYNVFDFSPDPVLRRRAGYLLDLHWAMWAQEQIDGVRGGPKMRIYQTGGDRVDNTETRKLAWFYFGFGEATRVFSPLLSALTSIYRPPLVVIDLALDVAGRGRYEIHHRPMGLVEEGYDNPPDYRLKIEGGGVACYSWCTPAFIMGTPMVEARPIQDWAKISSQNRWHGVIFAGHPDARIVPQVKAPDGSVAFNAQWSVQRKGSLICQKLRTSEQAEEMRVWFSTPGLSNRREENDWVFVEAPEAYAAVRVVNGGAEWDKRPVMPPHFAQRGEWLLCHDQWTPVIIEIACKEDFADYGAFRHAVSALPLAFDDGVLKYTGFHGDEFAFCADQSKPPLVNCEPVDYMPSKVLDSPFLQAEWGSGVVLITKEGRSLTLDFTQE